MNAARYRLADGTLRIGRLDGDTVINAGPAPTAGFVPTGQTWRRAADAARPRLSGLDALAIGGVTCTNDVSGRTAQLESPGGQFTRGKSFDTIAPLGPSVTSVDGRDLGALRDVIATGTLGGVGHARTPPCYLRAGDFEEVDVAGVGTLRNPVIAERPPEAG